MNIVPLVTNEIPDQNGFSLIEVMFAIVILAFALVQIVVHMVYFLHMNFHSEGGWNMLALIFTLILVFITLAGSLWVMYNLNVNMMPGMMD